MSSQSEITHQHQKLNPNEHLSMTSTEPGPVSTVSSTEAIVPPNASCCRINSSSHFLNLPLEIRQLIYSFALYQPRQLIPVRAPSQREKIENLDPMQLAYRSPFTLDLLRVCRQIDLEAAQIFYQINGFFITSWPLHSAYTEIPCKRPDFTTTYSKFSCSPINLYMWLNGLRPHIRRAVRSITFAVGREMRGHPVSAEFAWTFLGEECTGLREFHLEVDSLALKVIVGNDMVSSSLMHLRGLKDYSIKLVSAASESGPTPENRQPEILDSRHFYLYRDLGQPVETAYYKLSSDVENAWADKLRAAWQRPEVAREDEG